MTRPGRGPRRPAPRRSGGGSGRRATPPSARRRGGSRGREGLGGDQVEGRQAVRELLLAGRRRVREVWLAQDLDPAPILDEILELAAEQRVPVQRVKRGRLEAVARTDAPQGVLAFAAPLPIVDLDDLARRPGPGGAPPFLVLLDGITDPANLGAILRSADGAGVTGVVLPRHGAAHVTPSAAKAAAGAVEHLPIAVVPGLPNAMRRLRELGVWLLGLDAAAERTLYEVSWVDGPLGLVLGAEGAGLSRLVRERCDGVAAIPLRGRLSSLNVGVAAAVACFEVARRREPEVGFEPTA